MKKNAIEMIGGPQSLKYLLFCPIQKKIFHLKSRPMIAMSTCVISGQKGMRGSLSGNGVVCVWRGQTDTSLGSVLKMGAAWGMLHLISLFKHH